MIHTVYLFAALVEPRTRWVLLRFDYHDQQWSIVRDLNLEPTPISFVGRIKDPKENKMKYDEKNFLQITNKQILYGTELFGTIRQIVQLKNIDGKVLLGL